MKTRKKHTRKRKTRKTKKKTRKTKKKTRKTKKKNFKKRMCSPRKKRDMLDYTCYKSGDLLKMKDIWNKKHPKQKIKESSPKKIWKAFKNNLNAVCNNERCWLKHKCIKHGLDKDVITNTFAPKQPKSWHNKPNEWLTSIDINRFMKQHRKTYYTFTFLGPSPIDFDHKMLYDECVWEELCKFNLERTLKRGKTNIGVIFNLDPHYKDGSHWVAVYIKARKKGIYYFDSYGERIPPRIMKFVKMVQTQSKKLGTPYKFYQNKLRHQYSNSECGMYCLYFIKHMLHTGDFKSISKKKIPDKKMLKLRNIYFNKH